MLTSSAKPAQPPDVASVISNRIRLDDLIWETPVLRWGQSAEHISTRELWLKLEVFQVTGSFKPRGALTVITQLTTAQRAQGLVTVSSGNHAIALAYGARKFGCHAQVYMAESADEYRIERARALGADVHLVKDSRTAFEDARCAVEQRGHYFVHPFDGPWTTLGTASIAIELDVQLPRHIDTFVVAIGGGSLASGLAPTIKALRPGCRVIGIEPAGAPTLTRSLALGQPATLDTVTTIADSLAVPFAEAYSFELIRDYVDEILLIDDDCIRQGMRLLFETLKLAVEPSGATALAGVLAHPSRFTGRNVCAIVCGSNIGLPRYRSLLGEAFNHPSQRA
jgi:threonine dehydratase